MTTPSSLEKSIVSILSRERKIIGTGFIVHDSGLFVTCSHVLEQAGIPRGGAFQVIVNDQRIRAHLIDRYWRAPANGDIAFATLSVWPDNAKRVTFGSSSALTDRGFRTIGHPVGANWIFADGTILGVSKNGHIQLGKSNEITSGFSGAPLVDKQTGLVVGMVVSKLEPDDQGQLTQTAFAIRSERICTIADELQIATTCPYKDLAFFEEQDAHLWCGRGDIVAEVMEAYDSVAQWIGILGPSGSGKSSLIRAGVTPRLRAAAPTQGVAIITLRPNDVVSSLRQSMNDAQIAPGTMLFGQQIGQGDILVIDQFEDIFVTFEASERQAFLQSLWSASDRIGFRTIVVMRDDFYSQLARDAPNIHRAIVSSLVQIPMALSRQSLRDMVKTPAQYAGLSFDPENLDDIIASAAIKEIPGPERDTALVTALPLLQVSLTRLWELRKDGLLARSVFDDVQLTNVLSARAEAAYLSLSSKERSVADHLLIELIDPRKSDHWDKGGRVDLKQMRAAERNAALDTVLACFTKARILVTRRDRVTGEEFVELIHDSLLTRWNRYQHLRSEFGDLVALRGDMARSLAKWKQSRRTHHLLTSDELTRVSTWRGRGARFSDELQNHIRRSSRWRLLIVIALTILFSAAVAFAVVFAAVANESRTQRNRAEAAAKASHAEQLAAQGEVLMRNDLRTGLNLIAYAFEQGCNARGVVRSALDAIVKLASVRGAADIDSLEVPLAISSDGQWIAGQDKNNRLAIMSADQRTTVTSTSRLEFGSVRFSDDSKTLVVVDRGLLVVAKLDAGAWTFKTFEKIAGLRAADVSSTGTIIGLVDQTLVSISDDGTVKTLVGAEPAMDCPSEDDRRPYESDDIIGIDVSPDGTAVATVNTAQLVVWRNGNGSRICVPSPDRRGQRSADAPVRAVAISTDGRTAVVGMLTSLLSVDLEIGRVDTFDGIPTEMNELWVTDVAFAPDGRLVAAFLNEKSRSTLLSVWGASACERRYVPASCVPDDLIRVPGGVVGLQFGPSGILTAAFHDEHRPATLSMLDSPPPGESANDSGFVVRRDGIYAKRSGALARIWPRTDVSSLAAIPGGDDVLVATRYGLYIVSRSNVATRVLAAGVPFLEVVASESVIVARSSSQLFIWRDRDEPPVLVDATDDTVYPSGFPIPIKDSAGNEQWWEPPHTLVIGTKRIGWNMSRGLYIIDVSGSSATKLGPVDVCKDTEEIRISSDDSFATVRCTQDDESDDQRYRVLDLRQGMPLDVRLETSPPEDRWISLGGTDASREGPGRGRSIPLDMQSVRDQLCRVVRAVGYADVAPYVSAQVPTFACSAKPACR